jgi:hypothetical protein
LFIPRGVVGLGQFVIGLVTALIADPDVAPTGVVRRVWPDEESTLVARITESTGATHEMNPETILEGGAVAHVVVTDGPDQGARFEVTRWPITVGSAHECDIVLPELAPQQIRLLARGDDLVLYGLAEAPPVLVNEEPVTWSALEEGALIVLGPHSIRIEQQPQ